MFIRSLIINKIMYKIMLYLAVPRPQNIQLSFLQEIDYLSIIRVSDFTIFINYICFMKELE